ncbi:1601_t:CDS:2 [Entrophospora sp. SA101]|nr:1601_t:CDS:2 [Entrophospora sp. SA101]CAJ0836785.1 8509_t:CDS:2 [Entrophospora sp. SA101]
MTKKIKIENDMIIKRGEVYKFRVSRQETEGTEQQKNRPAVIVSTNRLNKKNVRFVAIPITSKKLEIIRPFEVPVMVAARKGKALCDQVRIYNESRIIKKEGKLGTLSEREIKEIGEKLLYLLDFEELEKLTKSPYDYLIIDGPARISEGTLNIAKVADLIIQPVGASLDDLNPAIREFNSLLKAGIPKNKLAFTLNRISSLAEEKAARNYLEKTGYYIFPLSLSEEISYREAQNEGKAISEKLKAISYEERLKYVEVLEKALECYEKQRKN